MKKLQVATAIVIMPFGPDPGGGLDIGPPKEVGGPK